MILLVVEYYLYDNNLPIYYALKREENSLQEYIWNGSEWIINSVDYLNYLLSEGSPYLEKLTEAQISEIATILV